MAILAENGIRMSEDEAHARFVGKTFCRHDRGNGTRARRALSCRRQRPEGPAPARPLRARAEAGRRDLRSPRGPAARGSRVASNSPEERVATALRMAGLEACLRHASPPSSMSRTANRRPTSSSNPRGAPAIRPEDCIVVEDSVTGVTAAARAGCAVLGFTGTHPDPQAHAARLAAAGAQTNIHRHARTAGAGAKHSFDIALQHAHIAVIVFGPL